MTHETQDSELTGLVKRRLAGGHRAFLVNLHDGTDAPICQDTPSGSQVCGLARSVVCHHALKDLAGEKAFETADDLPFGPPFLSRRLVRHLRTVVRQLIRTVDHRRHHRAARRGVAAELVGDQSARDTTLPFQQFPEEAHCGAPIST